MKINPKLRYVHFLKQVLVSYTSGQTQRGSEIVNSRPLKHPAWLAYCLEVMPTLGLTRGSIELRSYWEDLWECIKQLRAQQEFISSLPKGDLRRYILEREDQELYYSPHKQSLIHSRSDEMNLLYSQSPIFHVK